MNSLQRYILDGLKIISFSLVCALIIAAIVNIILQAIKKKKIRFKHILVIWYLVTLECVSFYYNLDSVNRVRWINIHIFKWLEDLTRVGVVVLWQVLLNFALYVPLGFMLAYFFRNRAKKFYIPIIIAAVSLFNEMTQYIFYLGSPDIDDFFINTLGGLWGVPLFGIYQKIKAKSKPAVGLSLCALCPFIVVVTVYAIYLIMPFGFVGADFKTAGMKIENINIDSLDLTNYESEAYTYKLPPKYNMDQLETLTHQIFTAFGEKENVDSYDKYDDLLVTYGEVQSYYTWVMNTGKFFLDTMEHGIEIDSNADFLLDPIRNILENAGIAVPDRYSNIEADYDDYIVYYDFVPYKNKIFYGTLEWNSSDNTIFFLKYNLQTLESTNKLQTLTEKAFYENLQEGNFNCGNLQDRYVENLICKEIELEYIPDTKGYFRPIYKISAQADGEPVVLEMPLE